MTEQTPDETAPADVHLEIGPYDDAERVEAPEWYDDEVNVGDLANALAEGEEPEGEPDEPEVTS